MENTNTNSEVVMGGSQSHVASSRWNPTKEQLRILESLYKQGIRTPTAEEIQQITARLSVYGHIEGKNVFYWFQNHKARQRQKQKQESIAFYNRYLRAPPPQPFFPHPPVCTNARCAPYFMPQAQNEMGFYPQHPKVVVPVGYMRNPAAEKAVPTGMSSMICTNDQLVYEGMQHRISGCNLSYNNQETLDLFPLHPTGILDGKTTTIDQVSSSSLASVSADSSTDTASASPDINQDYASPPNQPFFDFFSTSGQGS